MEQQKSIEWEEVTGRNDLWLPKIGDEIAVVVIRKEDGKFGVQCDIQTSPDKVLQTPSHKTLQGILAKISVGEIVKIKYLRDEPSKKGSPTRIYGVLRQKKAQPGSLPSGFPKIF